MIKSEAEAKLFFNWNENQYPGDVFVAKLFEFKTYFITKPPIKKPFFARLNKLEKMVEAYHFLLNLQSIDAPELQLETIQFSNNWYEDFNLLQQQRSIAKQQIFKYNHPVSIRNIVTFWIDVEENYQSIYGNILVKQNTDEIIASKEIDPMELLEILKIENERIPLNEYFLKNKAEELSKILVNELKRLNLLLKLQSHE